MATVTVSAPGKALVAGGYLILEPSNKGITISSTSRFFSTVSILDAPVQNISQSQLIIVVESPQFNTSFEYQYDIHSANLVATSESSNAFVEKCLSMVISYTRESLGSSALSEVIGSVSAKGKLGVKLRADNDFYSQIKELQVRNLPLTSNSLKKLPQFNPCPKDEEGNTIVIKTGMGSSAALTTSLVGGLLGWFKVIQLDATSDNVRFAEDRRILHNLAQLAHAVAQGKIGSGFDVAAAVYGSQTYKRFSPEGFEACMKEATSSVIFSAVNNSSLWTQTISPFTLPPNIDLIMGDVCGGSSSVSMAREVLKWKAQKPEKADVIWLALAQVNEDIHTHFDALSLLAKTDEINYQKCMLEASNSTYTQWLVQTTLKSGDDGDGGSDGAHTVLQLLITLRNLFCNMRELMRRMGGEAGVEIEPPAQTILADKTEALKGVLSSGVPGAGGNDAIFAIVLSCDARSLVEGMWSEYGTGTGIASQGGVTTIVCPLMLNAENGLEGGVRVEKMEW